MPDMFASSVRPGPSGVSRPNPWLAACVLIGGSAFVGYAVLHPASALMMDEAKDTRKAVLKRVPVGSTPDAARSALTDDGFACVQMTNSAFTVHEPDSQAAETHPPTDYLWCDSGDLGLGFTKRWQVFLPDRGGTVSGVAVSVTLRGPFGSSEPMPQVPVR